MDLYEVRDIALDHIKFYLIMGKQRDLQQLHKYFKLVFLKVPVHAINSGKITCYADDTALLFEVKNWNEWMNECTLDTYKI